MSITAYSHQRIDRQIVITAESDLSGQVFYHWYVSGVWAAVTNDGRFAIYLNDGIQARVECVDTNDADFDAAENLPEELSPVRTLWWTRSVDTDTSYYIVEQKEDAGDYAEVARIWQGDEWTQSFVTDALTDLATYYWRITPVDTSENEGTPTVIGPDVIVRRPDAPDFTVEYDSGTQKITFEAA